MTDKTDCLFGMVGLQVVSDELTQTHLLQTLPLGWEGGYSAAETSKPWLPVRPSPHPQGPDALGSKGAGGVGGGRVKTKGGGGPGGGRIGGD